MCSIKRFVIEAQKIYNNIQIRLRLLNILFDITSRNDEMTRELSNGSLSAQEVKDLSIMFWLFLKCSTNSNLAPPCRISEAASQSSDICR